MALQRIPTNRAVTSFSVDAKSGFISVTLSDGRTFTGDRAMKDLQVSWKTKQDSRFGWSSTEDQIWYDEGRADRLRRERLIKSGSIDF